MKVAVCIEDGITQLVLMPENEWEKSASKVIEDGKETAVIQRGSFYRCQGGWERQGSNNDSLILTVEKETP